MQLRFDSCWNIRWILLSFLSLLLVCIEFVGLPQRRTSGFHFLIADSSMILEKKKKIDVAGRSVKYFGNCSSIEEVQLILK